MRWPERQIRGWLERGRIHPGYITFFYRDPEREPPTRPGILAPADGRVTSLDSRDGLRYLVIALTYWDVHVQRSPLAGRVREIQRLGDSHRDGEGRDFAFLNDKFCPVQSRIVIEGEKVKLAVRLITSLSARRIEAWVGVGDTVERGERIGRILLGSTVVLELPEDWPVAVRVGDTVRAGESLLAEAGRAP